VRAVSAMNDRWLHSHFFTVSTGATNVKASKVDKAKKKKKRKPLRPKNLDPNAKPDPERWLPMKERSYYRPRATSQDLQVA